MLNFKGTQFVKWPSIEAFHNVYRRNSGIMYDNAAVRYHSKVKIHGTNTAIRVGADGSVIAQGRRGDITPDMDGYKFGAWVESTKSEWAKITKAYPFQPSIVIFGEWAGPGVQKDVAVSRIEAPYFFIFGVYFPFDDALVSDPDAITAALRKSGFDFSAVPEMIVLPYFGEYLIEFENDVSVRALVDRINADVSEIDREDPFIKATFDVSGKGEGLVFFPETETLSCPLDHFEKMAFKAKGVTHQVVKGEPAAKIGAWASANNREFAEKFLTENRFEQGLQEACNGIADMKFAGDFLKWIGGDVKKESVDELEASGLEWSQVAKMVNAIAMSWFKKQVAKGQSSLKTAA